MRQAMEAAIDDAIKALHRARALPCVDAAEELPAVAALVATAEREALRQVEDHERVEGRPIRRAAAADQVGLFAGAAS